MTATPMVALSQHPPEPHGCQEYSFNGPASHELGEKRPLLPRSVRSKTHALDARSVRSKLRETARRRNRRTSVAGVTAACAIVVLAVSVDVGMGVLRTAPQPADQDDRAPVIPTSVYGVPGIPTSVYGVPGDGGLRLEKDLAVGRASVAVVNDTNAFVITAADGVYHRLALPGFDASLYATSATGEGVGDLPVLALSPDGTKLAYAWHGPLPEHDPVSGLASPGEGWIESGARILDLTSGEIATYPSEPGGYGLTTLTGRLTWNFTWSPDSRYVAFGEVWTTNTAWAGTQAVPAQGMILDTATKVTWSHLGPQTNPRPLPLFRDYDPAWLQRPSLIVTPSGLVAWAEGQQMTTWDGEDTKDEALAAGEPWSGGVVAPDARRVLLEPEGLGESLLLVDLDSHGTDHLLRLDGGDWPEGAKVDLLGWVGESNALAMIRAGTDQGAWEIDADLVLLALDPEEGLADATVVGHVTGTEQASAATFATDLATATAPTHEFAPPPFREGSVPFPAPTNAADPSPKPGPH